MMPQSSVSCQLSVVSRRLAVWTFLPARHCATSRARAAPPRVTGFCYLAHVPEHFVKRRWLDIAAIFNDSTVNNS